MCWKPLLRGVEGKTNPFDRWVECLTLLHTHGSCRELPCPKCDHNKLPRLQDSRTHIASSIPCRTLHHVTLWFYIILQIKHYLTSEIWAAARPTPYPSIQSQEKKIRVRTATKGGANTESPCRPGTALDQNSSLNRTKRSVL